MCEFCVSILNYFIMLINYSVHAYSTYVLFHMYIKNNYFNVIVNNNGELVFKYRFHLVVGHVATN